MLKEQKRIPNLVRRPPGREVFLQFPRLSIRHEAEAMDFADGRFAWHMA
jgi:hypothetical protein